MPLVPTPGRQRQEDFYEFQARLVYKVSSRTAKAITQRNLIVKTKVGGIGVERKKRKELIWAT